MFTLTVQNMDTLEYECIILSQPLVPGTLLSWGAAPAKSGHEFGLWKVLDCIENNE